MHSANGWEDMLLPEIERQQEQVLRLQNGDPTDGGLDFSSEPLVFRVSVASY